MDDTKRITSGVDRHVLLLPWLALGGWLALSATAEYLRPGELLEFGLVGIAGAAAWTLVRTLPSRRLQLMAALVFLVPLLNTWPTRAALAQIESAGAASYLLAPGSLLAVLLVVVAPVRWRSRPAAFPLLFASLVAAAAVMSSIASGDLTSAASSAWVALLAPTAVGLAVAGAALDSRMRWTVVAVMALAGLVPAAMALVAYVVSFSTPLSVDDLIEGKRLMARTGLVQEVTFGNVAHLTAFALLVAPVAAVTAFARSLPLVARAGAAVSAALLTCAVFLSFSRAGFFALALVLVVAAGLVALRGFQERSSRAFALALILAAAAVPVAALGASRVEATPTGRTGGGAPTQGFGEDSSADFRWSSIRSGLSVFEDNLLGVGSERYALYDPEHTAPHSLFVRVLAETGVLGGAAFVALLLLLCGSLRWLVHPSSDDEWLLRLGCTLGVGGFLAYAMVAGAPLAIGAVNAWAMLLAVQVGLLLSGQRWK